MKYWIKPGIFLPLCQESPCFPPQAAPDSPQLQNDVWNKTLRIITIIYPESLHQRLWFKKFQKISKLLSSRDRAEGLHRKMDFVLLLVAGELRYIGNQSNTYEGVNNDVLPWEKLSIRMFSICFFCCWYCDMARWRVFNQREQMLVRSLWKRTHQNLVDSCFAGTFVSCVTRKANDQEH